MSYPAIIVPTEGDGTTFALIGLGHYRGQRLAAAHFRVLSYLIDLAPPAILSVITTATRVDLIANVGALLALAVWFLNVVFMQSRTGQSLGKLCLGMVLVRPLVDPMNVADHYYAPAKMPMLVFRAAMEGFDLFLGVGILFVTFTRRRESIADRICNTMVLRPYDLNAIKLRQDLTGAQDR